MTALPPGDWSPWIPCRPNPPDSPYRHKHVEAWRREWGAITIVEVAKLPPESNVAGLFWRTLDAEDAEPS